MQVILGVAQNPMNRLLRECVCVRVHAHANVEGQRRGKERQCEGWLGWGREGNARQSRAGRAMSHVCMCTVV